MGQKVSHLERMLEKLVFGDSVQAKSAFLRRVFDRETISSAIDNDLHDILREMLRSEIAERISSVQQQLKTSLDDVIERLAKAAVERRLVDDAFDFDRITREAARAALSPRANQIAGDAAADIRNDFRKDVRSFLGPKLDDILAEGWFQERVGNLLDAAIAREVANKLAAREAKVDDLLVTRMDAKVDAAIERQMSNGGNKLIQDDIQKLVPAAIQRHVESAAQSAITDEVLKADVDAVVATHAAGRMREPDFETYLRNRFDAELKPLVPPFVQDTLAGLASRVDDYGVEAMRRIFESRVSTVEIHDLMAKVALELAKTAVHAVPEKKERPPHQRNKGEIHHPLFSQILPVVRAGVGNVLLVGPAGSGKSIIAEQIAVAMNRSFAFTGPIQSEYKLTGYRDANGNYHSTPFRRAFEEGGVYLFDELDACSPQVLITFNAALSSEYFDFPDETVKKHGNFVCIAAANTFGRGASHIYMRNQLDAATIDRFIIFKTDYDREFESSIVKNPGWLKRVQGYRDFLSQTSLDPAAQRHVISMRAAAVGAAILALGVEDLNMDRVEELVIWKGLDAGIVSRARAHVQKN